MAQVKIIVQVTNTCANSNPKVYSKHTTVKVKQKLIIVVA